MIVSNVKSLTFETVFLLDNLPKLDFLKSFGKLSAYF